MTTYSLLVLDLRTPVPYTGVENPPLTGAPLEGSVMIPMTDGGIVECPVGDALKEDEEELFLFDEAELIRFDPDDGPRLATDFPRPGFYGRNAPRHGQAGAEGRELARGTYAFMQWRPADAAELLGGLEWFARETWWERSRTEGPYILRRLREDGKLATQILRRLKP